MKSSGPEITTNLRENLQVGSGRHLYAVLGTYAQLDAFENEILAQVSLFPQEEDPQSHQGAQSPQRAQGAEKTAAYPRHQAVNLNLAMMERIGDDDLRDLVSKEGTRRQTIQKRLGNTFNALLEDLLAKDHFLILKQIELLFAYDLDLQVIRAKASNQNHILLLLPGEKRGDHVALFTEASARFHRELPYQLIADNHLWEL